MADLSSIVSTVIFFNNSFHYIIKNQSVKKKLENNETLSEKELMLLIILPLAKKGKEVKQKVIEQVVDLAKQIEDENTQVFVITGILVSSDKFIDRDYAKSVRRYLSMTKVFQSLEEEKLEAVNIAKRNERQYIPHLITGMYLLITCPTMKITAHSAQTFPAESYSKFRCRKRFTRLQLIFRSLFIYTSKETMIPIIIRIDTKFIITAPAQSGSLQCRPQK